MSEHHTDEPGPERPGRGTREAEAAGDKGIENQAREMLKMFAEAAKSGSTATCDTLSQALLMVLGSGPAFSAFESMLAANRADGLMFYNAVSNQQKTNMISMAVTAKCVKYMLNVTPDLDDDDLIDEAVEDALDDD
jgi:Killing trait